MNQESIRYLESFYLTPYIFGGDDFTGIDCSGLAIEFLKACGITLPAADMTAQRLFDHFSTVGNKDVFGPGALCFYGKTTTNISHVTVMVNTRQCIGANGGTSGTYSKELASINNAFVKLRPFDYRTDLVAVYMPKYIL